MKGIPGRLLLLMLTLTAVIASDQATKHYFKNRLRPGAVVRVAGDLFILTPAENQGGFLSMGNRLPAPVRSALLVYLPLFITLFAFVYLARNQIIRPALGTAPSLFLMAAVAGGASNLFDRFNHGAVFDFMNFGIGDLRTGILNTADLFITFGMIAFALSFPGNKKRDGRGGHPVS